MPDKRFLEEVPLYKQTTVKFFGSVLDSLPRVSINMYCGLCESNQTFTMINNYWEANEAQNANIGTRILRLTYRCMHCNRFPRHFYVLVDGKERTLEKVGQYPPWDISGNKDIENRLGDHARYYRRGLICESQGYGIGAFSYYRRIVEEIIDALLDEISNLLTGEDFEKYQDALRKTKETTITQEKIALVKDLLPDRLRPGGMNPLGVLHSVLSDGLHAKSDDDCLEDAAACRTVLIFLAAQIAANKNSAKEFTESMQKLLEKKAQRERKE